MQIHHSNAVTNLNIREQIQNNSAKNLELASRFNVSTQTVSKWKHRDFLEDASCAPLNIKYALSDVERSLAISIRSATWIPIDEVWEALLETNSKISRSSIYRCFVKQGINKVPQEKNDKAKKFKAYNYTEAELRQIWSETYCEQKILTFDDIVVKFYSGMFDHCFYESENRREKDKSILSLNRLEKIYWIKDALEDPDSIRKQGWDRKNKRNDNSRRVTLVKGNYIVVIIIYAKRKARFLTAYEVNDSENLEKILNSPDWT